MADVVLCLGKFPRREEFRLQPGPFTRSRTSTAAQPGHLSYTHLLPDSSLYLVQAASVVVPVCTRGHFISPGYIAFRSFPLSFTTSLEQLRKIVPRYASDLTLLEAWAYHGIDQRIRPHNKIHACLRLAALVCC